MMIMEEKSKSAKRKGKETGKCPPARPHPPISAKWRAGE